MKAEENLVERVAKSLAGVFPNGSDTLHYQYEKATDDYTDLANAALEASGLLPLLSAATTFIEECDRMGWGETSETALPGSFDLLRKAVNEVRK